MQPKINIVLFKPGHPRFKILDSYLEVIDSLIWGFTALGYDCTYRVNEIDRGRTNIVFGWIPAFLGGFADQFPPDSILYNLEQFSQRPMRGMSALELAAERFQVWDYAPGNIRQWQELNPKHQPYYARVAFAPSLVKPPAPEEDIDISYVGSLSATRAAKIIDCTNTDSNYSVVTLSNVWGRQRDDFIARSKVMLNISGENPAMTIFEIVRVSFYLANRKAVVCELLPQLEIEDDMRSALCFAPTDQLRQSCQKLLDEPAYRRDYVEASHEAFRSRDVIRGFFG
jgi:hypothetical protein